MYVCISNKNGETWFKNEQNWNKTGTKSEQNRSKNE